MGLCWTASSDPEPVDNGAQDLRPGLRQVGRRQLPAHAPTYSSCDRQNVSRTKPGHRWHRVLIRDVHRDSHYALPPEEQPDETESDEFRVSMNHAVTKKNQIIVRRIKFRNQT
jgi:hypothetical protein